jgi:hypothetical protein
VWNFMRRPDPLVKYKRSIRALLEDGERARARRVAECWLGHFPSDEELRALLHAAGASAEECDDVALGSSSCEYTDRLWRRARHASFVHRRARPPKVVSSAASSAPTTSSLCALAALPDDVLGEICARLPLDARRRFGATAQWALRLDRAAWAGVEFPPHAREWPDVVYLAHTRVRAPPKNTTVAFAVDALRWLTAGAPGNTLHGVDARLPIDGLHEVMGASLPTAVVRLVVLWHQRRRAPVECVCHGCTSFDAEADALVRSTSHFRTFGRRFASMRLASYALEALDKRWVVGETIRAYAASL